MGYAAIAAAAAGIGSSIFGGIKSADAAYKQRKALRKEKRKARREFNREYYQDLTQRADMKYLLNKQREQLNEANTIARQRNVVAGGTTEAEAVAKNAAAKAMAESTARISALSQENKRQALSNYRSARRQNDLGLAAINQQQAQQGLNLAISGGNMLVGAIGSLADSATTTTSGKDTTTGGTTPPPTATNNAASEIDSGQSQNFNTTTPQSDYDKYYTNSYA